MSVVNIEDFSRRAGLPGSLELAFLGDSIYDLYVRARLIQKGGRMKQLNSEAVKRVRASAQSAAFEHIEPLLTETEFAVARRARNAKQTAPRSADPADYQRATALEAVLGFLYVTGQIERMEELIREALT